MQLTPWRITLVTLVLSFGYAVARYVVFQGVSTAHLPLYVANKAISLTGLILIDLASLGRSHEQRKMLGLLGIVVVGVHVLASLVILEPAYFAKMYDATGRLTWQAELSMLAGAVGCMPLLCLLWATPHGPRPDRPGTRSLIPGLGRVILVCTAVHVAAIGYGGWMDTASWPGRLPPITLLSFVAALALLSAKSVIARRKQS